MSPAWHMKSGRMRWKVLYLYQSGTLPNPMPFSPVQRQRKLSHVFGQTVEKSSISTRPTRFPSMSMSKKTRGFDGRPATSSTLTLRFVPRMSGGCGLKMRSARFSPKSKATKPKSHVYQA